MKYRNILFHCLTSLWEENHVEHIATARQFVIRLGECKLGKNIVKTLSSTGPLQETRHSSSMATIRLDHDVICSHPIEQNLDLVKWLCFPRKLLIVACENKPSSNFNVLNILLVYNAQFSSIGTSVTKILPINITNTSTKIFVN